MYAFGYLIALCVILHYLLAVNHDCPPVKNNNNNNKTLAPREPGMLGNKWLTSTLLVPGKGEIDQYA